jgi:hypothetical protein
MGRRILITKDETYFSFTAASGSSALEQQLIRTNTFRIKVGLFVIVCFGIS